MTDSPADPPEWITGPPADYAPPPIDTLTDPAVRTATASEGAELVRQALAKCGITKTGKAWITPNSEGTKR